MNLTTKINQFIRHNERPLQVLIILLGLVLVISFSYYGYATWKQKQEKDLSNAISQLLEKTDKARAELSTETGAEKTQEKEETDEAAEGKAKVADREELSRLSEALYQLYLENTSKLNGGRALYLSANLDFKLAEEAETEAEKEAAFAKAREKYTTLFEKHPKHYLAANALFMLCDLEEAAKNYSAAGIALDQFLSKYPEHFLRGEVLLNKARYLVAIKDYEGANQLYEEVLADEKFALQADSAERSQQLLRVAGYLKKVEPVQTFLPTPGTTPNEPTGQETTAPLTPQTTTPQTPETPEAPDAPAPETPETPQAQEEGAPQLISPFKAQETENQ